jgi:hypothetical protein
MTREPGAQKRPPGDNPRGGDSGVQQILQVWATGGTDSHDSAPSHDPATTSPAPSTVQVTDDASKCFDKASLARYLRLSVRTLDRLAAQGLLPAADLTISGSKRWLQATISRWLLGKPKLSGRKGGRS